MSGTIGLKLDDEMRARLQQLGKTRDRSPHWLMKTAIVEYLDREERIEQERLEDEARWQRWRQTGAHLDHDSMVAWLDGLATQAERATTARADSQPDAAQARAAADEPGEWR